MATETSLLLGATASHVGAMFILLVCFSMPAWIVGGHVGNVVAIGLWEACLNDECASIFDDNSRLIETLGGWFRAVQALLAISVTGFFLSFIFSLLSLCRRSMSTRGSQTESNFWAIPARVLEAAVVLLACGLFTFGIKAYTQNIHGDIFYYGGCFYGCMMSCMLGAIAAILYELAHSITYQIRLGYIVLKS